MGAYKYLQELWRKKQSDVMRFLARLRTWEYRQLPAIHRCSRPSRPASLDLHHGAGLLELLLRVLADLLGLGLQDGARVVHHGLGLLQAHTQEAAHDLQDGDLLGLRHLLEHHVELRLLGRLLLLLARGRRGHHHGPGAGGGVDAEGLLDGLHELRGLQERELLQGLHDRVDLLRLHGDFRRAGCAPGIRQARDEGIWRPSRAGPTQGHAEQCRERQQGQRRGPGAADRECRRHLGAGRARCGRIAGARCPGPRGAA
mmetsp:Transcript_21801/g.68811  ORF Transcript_21801/g.68811 Transcript_21801/m.68811 type:complete len:257 (+) Transcript_21801:101-871(+)